VQHIIEEQKEALEVNKEILNVPEAL